MQNGTSIHYSSTETIPTSFKGDSYPTIAKDNAWRIPYIQQTIPNCTTDLIPRPNIRLITMKHKQNKSWINLYNNQTALHQTQRDLQEWAVDNHQRRTSTVLTNIYDTNMQDGY